MSSVAAIHRRSQCSDAEWAVRQDLAALYRACAMYGWTDLVFTHLTARVPGEPSHYLINPFPFMFTEITASNLLKLDFDGNVLAGEGEYIEAGHLIHSAVLKARPDVNFSMHTHTRAGTAVSAMACGLLPLSQPGGSMSGNIAYHDYGLVENDQAECDALGRDLGDKPLMILRNHGLLAVGRTAGEAFLYHYYLESACKVQVDVLQSGQTPVVPRREAIDDLIEWARPRPEPWGSGVWQTVRRNLDKLDPSYQS